MLRLIVEQASIKHASAADEAGGIACVTDVRDCDQVDIGRHTGRRPTAARPTPSTPRSTPQAPTVTRSSICGPGGSRLRHGVARHDARPSDPATARLRAWPYTAVSGLTSIGHEHSLRV
jgi:hypothetical protein